MLSTGSAESWVRVKFTDVPMYEYFLTKAGNPNSRRYSCFQLIISGDGVKKRRFRSNRQQTFPTAESHVHIGSPNPEQPCTPRPGLQSPKPHYVSPTMGDLLRPSPSNHVREDRLYFVCINNTRERKSGFEELVHIFYYYGVRNANEDHCK